MQNIRYYKLSAKVHTSVPQLSQKPVTLILIHTRNLGKVGYESSLPELSRHVPKLKEGPPKISETTKNGQKWQKWPFWAFLTKKIQKVQKKVFCPKNFFGKFFFEF